MTHLPKNFKIKTYNDDHQRAIQKRLFKLDCVWRVSEIDIFYTWLDRANLYIENKIISCGYSSSSFQASPFQEITIDDLYKYEFPPKQTSVLVFYEGRQLACINKDGIHLYQAFPYYNIPFELMAEVQKGIEIFKNL